MRSNAEEVADGTLDGLASEVEGLVEAESTRHSNLGLTPPSVAQHVLERLQSDLEVRSVGEIGPRVGELTRAARLSLALLKQLRHALDLDGDASIGMCVAAAARVTKGHASLSTICAHLCALLQVHTVEAIVPAVRQINLTSRRPAASSSSSSYYPHAIVPIESREVTAPYLS